MPNLATHQLPLPPILECFEHEDIDQTLIGCTQECSLYRSPHLPYLIEIWKIDWQARRMGEQMRYEHMVCNLLSRFLSIRFAVR